MAGHEGYFIVAFFSQYVIKRTSVMRVVVLVMAGIILLLVRAAGTVLKAPQTGEQPIDQIVVKPVVLMGDEGHHVQIAIRIIPTRDLKDF